MAGLEAEFVRLGAGLGSVADMDSARRAVKARTASEEVQETCAFQISR
ncbi:MAG: hypothetical protein ABSF15_11265 [Candidatus Sulfotelmatobacter sp.]